MKKKILIFYTSVGLGHKFIAQNISLHLQDQGFETKLEDMLQIESGDLVNRAQKFYFWMHRAVPWFWGWLYKTPLTYLLLPFRLRVAAKHSERAKQLIREYDPDMIISTEVNPSAVVAYLKKTGFYTKPFGISFSDFHIHRFWIYKEADFYLVNIKEQKEYLMRKMRVPADRILVNGIPMWPKKIDTNAVRKKLGIKAKKVMVVSAGSLGYGVDKYYILRLLKQIEENYNDFVLLLVCGKFQMLYNDLSKIDHENLKVYGFYTPMDELYAVSDIFIGKPGGLSTTEALLWNLPIVLTHWMAGGEELNVRYLTKNRLIMPVKRTGIENKGAIQEIINELRDGKFRNNLRNHRALIESIANNDPVRLGDFVREIFANLPAGSAK
jgi:processive 1,2-diacylglycerol beta-glucosyltransferase